MTALDFIKNRVKNLYETNPNIHVNYKFRTPEFVLKMTQFI